MGVLDFLKVKKGAPATQIAEMQASLSRVRAEMTQATAIVESHGQRRADMLLSDASDSDIAKLDADVALAQIRLERLELAELELTERIEAARNASDRSNRATQLERAADAIESKTSAIDQAAAALYAAYLELLAAVPDDTSLQARKPRFAGDVPATREDIASAVAAQALAAHCPALFEDRPSTMRSYGAAIEKILAVREIDRDGRLSPVLMGERGEQSTISTADKAAERIIVAPLRAAAARLRQSDEMALAAE